MLALEGQAEYTHIIKKSKFIAYIFAVFTEEDAATHIHNLKTVHSNATHVCYAYITSNPQREKCFDDGEPKGTAGLPMLNVLKKQELQNILVVVVRYFGGVKLGGGGLLKAYMDACIGVIKRATFKKHKRYHLYHLTTQLNTMQPLESLLNAMDIRILEQRFSGTEVVYEVASATKLPADVLTHLKSMSQLDYKKTKYLSEE